MPTTSTSPDNGHPVAPTEAGTAIRLAILPILSVAYLIISACSKDSSTATTDLLAPGVVHHEIYLVQGPWSIHVLEIDLPIAWAAGIRLRAAASSSASEGEKTSTLAEGVIAAINGDFFFASGRPLGMQITDGVLRQEPHSRSAFVISADGKPLIDVFRLRGGLITRSGRALPINGLNRKSVKRGSSFFNPFAEISQDSVHADVGFKLQPLADVVGVNDTVACRVLQVRRRSWPLRLEQGQWLAAFGAGDVVESISPGDTVEIYLNLPPAASPLQEGVGGGPRIVRDGSVSIEYEREHLDYGFATDRNSRTAIGYTRDQRTMFLVTVDGGQPGYSVGMRLEELGHFMVGDLDDFTAVGDNAYQAMNMDGGGSSTMVISGQVVNRPSDPIGERPVGNALLVIDRGRKD